MREAFVKGAGAGRKSGMTLEYQGLRRGTVERVVTEEEWEYVIRALLERAKAGSVTAFHALAPWVMGAEPKHVSVTVDVEARIRALAIAAGLAPEDALVEARHILAITGEATDGD